MHSFSPSTQPFPTAFNDYNSARNHASEHESRNMDSEIQIKQLLWVFVQQPFLMDMTFEDILRL